MNRFVFTALCATTVCASAVSAQDQTPITASPATPLILQKVQVGSSFPSNSEVWVSLDRPLNSKQAKMGERFDVTVSRDVAMGDYIVIPRGTHGHGQISYRTGKGAFGKSAKMEFDITDVELGDRSIPLSGHYRLEGQGNTGATVGAVVAVGPFGAFVTGHSASADQGSEWKAATKESILVAVAPAPAATTLTAVPATTGATLTPAVVTVVKN
jgi:hypothetical protein